MGILFKFSCLARSFEKIQRNIIMSYCGRSTYFLCRWFSLYLFFSTCSHYMCSKFRKKIVRLTDARSPVIPLLFRSHIFLSHHQIRAGLFSCSATYVKRWVWFDLSAIPGMKAVACGLTILITRSITPCAHFRPSNQRIKPNNEKREKFINATIFEAFSSHVCIFFAKLSFRKCRKLLRNRSERFKTWKQELKQNEICINVLQRNLIISFWRCKNHSFLFNAH